MQQNSSSAIEEAKGEAREAVLKLIKELLLAAVRKIFGIKEKERMPTAPMEPEDQPQKEETPQATMDKPKKEKPHKPKKKRNKMLAVENKFPVREASGVKRTIMDTHDGYFRVNYKAWVGGCVTETAVVEVKDDGTLIVHEHINYEKE